LREKERRGFLSENGFFLGGFEPNPEWGGDHSVPGKGAGLAEQKEKGCFARGEKRP